MADRIDNIRAEKAEALKKQALEQAKRRRLYQECFGTPAGRMVLLDILTRAYLFSSTFTGNSQSYFNEGARAFGLELIQVIPGIAGEVIASHFHQVEDDTNKELGERG